MIGGACFDLPDWEGTARDAFGRLVVDFLEFLLLGLVVVCKLQWL